MSKKARAKKKGNRSNTSVVAKSLVAKSVEPSANQLLARAVPEPEVSTIRLHDAALDDDASPSIIPPAPLEVKPRATIASVPEAKPEVKVARASSKDQDDEAISMAFFDAQNTPSIAPVEIDVDDEPTNESVAIRRLTLSPAGIARRAQLGRYVAAAVGLAAIVGLAGAVKSRSMRDAMSAQLAERPALAAEPRAAVQPIAAQVPQVPAQPAVPAVQVPVPTPETVKPVEEVKPTEAKVVEEKKDDKKAEVPAAADDKPAEEKKAELDPVQAKKQKTAAHNALESGKHAKAIEAGERSVALDPTDAEAWLILGVAYQEKGNKEEAKRCFKSCLTEGKRGPKGECAMMAH